MTVYADILFLINFAFDLEVLLILLRLYSKKIPPVKLLLSTCIGGLQGIFVFIPYFRMLCSPPARLLVPLLMVALVFFPCRTKELFGAWITFLVISFVFSGLISFLEIKGLWGLLLLVPVYAAVCFVKRRAVKKTGTAVLIYKDRKISEQGFFDSGNMLSSCGNPVILANDDVFKRLFGSGFSINAAAEWTDACDLRVVPYNALGKQGVVFGIRLDCIVVDGKRYDNAVLGYCEDKFSDNLILNGIMT